MKSSILIILTASFIATLIPAFHTFGQTFNNPWAQWENTPQSADFFPIGVWAQDPKAAGEYKKLGVNYYFALHGGPTAEQMKYMRQYQMAAVCNLNDYARKNLLDEPLIWGWMHSDEPDLAHVYPRDFLRTDEGKALLKEKWPELYKELDLDHKQYEGWGMGAHPILDIQADYKAIKEIDDTRPVFLQLSKAVANEGVETGRGSDSGNVAVYPQYMAGSDIISFDIYPVAYGTPDKLWLPAKGLDQLKKWGSGNRPLMFIAEAGFGDPAFANHHQQRAEIWFAINHGASSITWFCHRWQNVDGRNTFVTDRMPLANKEVGQAVKAINDEIHLLAAVINSPALNPKDIVHTAGIKLDLGVRKHSGALYIFSVEATGKAGQGVFEIENLGDATAYVINEDRQIEIKGGRFTDDFNAWSVHLYKILPDKN